MYVGVLACWLPGLIAFRRMDIHVRRMAMQRNLGTK